MKKKSREKQKLSTTVLLTLSKQQEFENDALGLIVNSPLDFADRLLKSKELFNVNGIETEADVNFADILIVKNGCIDKILIYPLKHKVVFKQNNKSYHITTSFENIIALVKGELDFCKQIDKQ